MGRFVDFVIEYNDTIKHLEENGGLTGEQRDLIKLARKVIKMEGLDNKNRARYNKE